MANSVLIVNGNSQYEWMFLTRGWEITEDLLEATLVQFTGGEDVSPELYGEPKHPFTMNSPRRDAAELALAKKAYALGKPLAGICRGSQFLNVFCGGSLWQHVVGHTNGDHQATILATGEKLQVTSTHHQVMVPAEDGIVLVEAVEGDLPRPARFEDYARVTVENARSIEAVLYPDKRTFCFQPHPEFQGAPCQDYYFEQLERLLDV